MTKNKLSERDHLIVEQARNIRKYCLDYPTCIGCAFMTDHGCVLCKDPCEWGLPEVEEVEHDD